VVVLASTFSHSSIHCAITASHYILYQIMNAIIQVVLLHINAPSSQVVFCFFESFERRSSRISLLNAITRAF